MFTLNKFKLSFYIIVCLHINRSYQCSESECMHTKIYTQCSSSTLFNRPSNIYNCLLLSVFAKAVESTYANQVRLSKYVGCTLTIFYMKLLNCFYAGGALLFIDAANYGYWCDGTFLCLYLGNNYRYLLKGPAILVVLEELPLLVKNFQSTSQKNTLK